MTARCLFSSSLSFSSSSAAATGRIIIVISLSLVSDRLLSLSFVPPLPIVSAFPSPVFLPSSCDTFISSAVAFDPRLLARKRAIASYESSSLSSSSSSTFLFAAAAATMSAHESDAILDGSTAAPPVPSLPIPPPIVSTTPGTWAHDTMSRRVESEILQRTYEEMKEEFHSPGFESALDNLNSLREELRNAGTTKLCHLKRLKDAGGESAATTTDEWEAWHAIMDPYVANGDTWLSAPWMVAEFFVYRRLMEAIGYFDSSNESTYRWDPFLKAKRAGLTSSVTSGENVMAKIADLPKTREGVGLAAAFALWGNKMDLSIWPADAQHAGRDVFSEILDKAAENLLHDDISKLEDACDSLRAMGGGNVDIIVDNAGFELVTDLALADYLVDSGVAKVVTFQLKSHPTFVSDAMEKDLRETVDHYANLDPDEYPNASAAGLRWRRYLDDGSWVCNEDSFWVLGSAMWDMPKPLRTDMKQRCNLAFVKGDANYRRLLGDRHWDYTAPFQDVVGSYFPCPVCALRTLKAEVGCGMDADQIERAKGLDDEWMVNGRFGVVHFGTGVGGAVAANDT